MAPKKIKKILIKSVPLLILLFLSISLCARAKEGSTSQPSVDEMFRFPWSEITSLADLVQKIYSIALGLVGVLALGMIIFGGLRYATSVGNPSAQTDARKIITQAIWGVVLLLSAYLILNTINPELVKLKKPVLKKIERADYESGMYDTETQTGILRGRYYKIKEPLSNSFKALKQHSGALSKDDYYLLIDKSKHMVSLMDKKTNKVANINGKYITASGLNFGSKDGCANGKTGCNNQGNGSEGDKITPVGTYAISTIKKGAEPDFYDRPNSLNKAVRSSDGKYNLGAAAIYLDSSIGYRGIAIHGSENDTNSSTNGCIRMHNAYVYVLADKVQSGMEVVIQN